MLTYEVHDTEVKDIERIFHQQKANQFHIGNTGIGVRKEKLSKLHEVIHKYRSEIKDALFKEYHKPAAEVDLTEIFPITGEIKFAKKNLSKWIKGERRKTPFALMGASSRIRYEPKGVVLIISPWNFPFNLTFGPLVSAIAAGNCVIVKPSEMTPLSSKLIKKIVAEVFHESEVAVVEGGVPTSQALLELPFNHIFFTGSPGVGKIVMEAAAKNLASVTLELGGKSPTVIDETADLKKAAKRVSWVKLMNNGQMCITPDYVIVHESVKKEFIKEVKVNIGEFYGARADESTHYARIVNEHHYKRVKALIEDAFEKGAVVEEGGVFNDTERFISPTVLTNLSSEAEIMKEEIFGPVLPIVSYHSLDEVITTINSREKPLAMYIYSRSKKAINYLVANTRAGATLINHNGVHFYNLELGFGGSNNSGIGRGHGAEGFKAFSNPRGIMSQNMPNALDLLPPPYTSFKQKLIDFTIKWF